MEQQTTIAKDLEAQHKDFEVRAYDAACKRLLSNKKSSTSL